MLNANTVRNPIFPSCWLEFRNVPEHLKRHAKGSCRLEKTSVIPPAAASSTGTSVPQHLRCFRHCGSVLQLSITIPNTQCQLQGKNGLAQHVENSHNFQAFLRCLYSCYSRHIFTHFKAKIWQLIFFNEKNIG